MAPAEFFGLFLVHCCVDSLGVPKRMLILGA